MWGPGPSNTYCRRLTPDAAVPVKSLSQGSSLECHVVAKPIVVELFEIASDTTYTLDKGFLAS